MRLGELDDLPAVLTTAKAAELLGVSTDHLWSLARSGTAPVEPLKLGRAYRWPTKKLLALIGVGGGEHCMGSPADPSGVVVLNERRSGS